MHGRDPGDPSTVAGAPDRVWLPHVAKRRPGWTDVSWASGWPKFAAAAAVVGTTLVVGAPPCGAAAAAAAGRRVTVAVYGDSVVEGSTSPNYARYGLVPALGAALARRGGLELGGPGLIPATPFRWTFNHSVFGAQPVDPVGWALAGYASPALDGPSGYSAIAVSRQATATATVDAPTVGVLFTRRARSGFFDVTAGASTWTLDARSTGGASTPTVQWLRLPPGAQTITVHGPTSGALVFDGAIGRRPVGPGRVQVEMENLGHAGHTLTEDALPRVGEALTGLRFDVSIFMPEYIYEYAAESDAGGAGTRFEVDYARALDDYGRRVRAYGGLCLIADNSPVPLPAAVLARFAAINRREARRVGCVHTAAPARLWNPATAVKDGLVIVDDVHPTPAGYRRIVNALVPAVLRLVRARVRAEAKGKVDVATSGTGKGSARATRYAYVTGENVVIGGGLIKTT